MMNFLQAAEAAPQQPGMGSFWVMMLLMIVVMYFFMWRPESKRRKEMAKFRDGLKKGDKIITAGGIYGVDTTCGDNLVARFESLAELLHLLTTL